MKHLFSIIKTNLKINSMALRQLLLKGLFYSLITAIFPLSLVSAVSAAEEANMLLENPVRFNQEIRPILSDNCFQCHGHDAENRKADLRLDTAKGIVEDLGGYQAVVPGNVEKSELYKRITHTDPEERMPPLKSHKTLTNKEIEKLAQWIKEGAPWEEHWAFEPIKSLKPQKVSDPLWVQNPIDTFVLKRLDQEQLKPAEAADKYTLIRRVSFDLTGLPPSPEMIEAFVSDTSNNAYEKLVDSLLASSAYGEHRANYWLDAARYADTHGLHLDNYRSIWPYRDWVIKAFNNNQPFDQFTIDQLAGDMLPGSTLQQKIATGFNRSNPTTSEGGAIDDEYLAIYAKDRAETTAAVWMGLTVGCATCHDHKFDPISQKEFYQFTAFFRNTTQPAMDGNSLDSRPYISVPRSQDLQKKVKFEEHLAASSALYKNKQKRAHSALATWLSKGGKHNTDIPVAHENVELTLGFNKGSGQQVLAKTKEDKFQLPIDGNSHWVKGTVGQALALGKDASIELGQYGKFTLEDAFSGSLWLMLPEGVENTGPILDYRIFENDKDRENNKSERGWRIEYRDNSIKFKIQTDNNSRLEVAGKSEFTPGTWNHIAFTYNGNGAPNGVDFYVNGKIIESGGDSTAASLYSSPDLKYPLAKSYSSTLRIGDKAKPKNQADDKAEDKKDKDKNKAQKEEKYVGFEDLRLFRGVLLAEQIKTLNDVPELKRIAQSLAQNLNKVQRKILADYYFGNINAEGKAMRADIVKLQQDLNEIKKHSAVTLVMEEKVDSQPSAHILKRGLYDQLGEQVDAGVLEIFKPLPESMPANRLALAQWLVDPEHPLTSRVTVNRFWQSLFGTGLVSTAGDFGSQGEPPSHPLLLDWLANEFMKNGWDIKHMFKLMVMSSTYRQSSRFTPELLAKDENNRLLARGPRLRLPAEAIRDQALFVSGLLVDKMGGPSVKPYQPDGLWGAVGYVRSNTVKFQQDHGENLYRKSLYTFRKRTSAPPSMNIFDAPSRETCALQRELTNSPLQALLLMNDPQFLEAARNLAQRTMVSGGDTPDDQYQWLLKTALGREPDAQMIAVLKDTHEKITQVYSENQESAQELIKIGESIANPELNTVDLAAWTMVVNQVMNMDEFISKN